MGYPAMEKISVLNSAEPWMRGTHADLDPVVRAVVHALELAVEDVAKWCEGMNEAEMFARPGGVAPVAFHLRHIVRSLDRLLTYAEGRSLDEKQLEELRTEMQEGAVAGVLEEFGTGTNSALERVRAVRPETFGEARGVGRKRLPTTVAGLLIHCAEHTSRHVGQVVTTAGVIRGTEPPSRV